MSMSIFNFQFHFQVQLQFNFNFSLHSISTLPFPCAEMIVVMLTDRYIYTNASGMILIWPTGTSIHQSSSHELNYPLQSDQLTNMQWTIFFPNSNLRVQFNLRKLIWLLMTSGGFPRLACLTSPDGNCWSWSPEARAQTGLMWKRLNGCHVL